jgi:hypothetical protein
MAGVDPFTGKFDPYYTPGSRPGLDAPYNPVTTFDPASYTGPTATQNGDGSFTWHDPVAPGGGGGPTNQPPAEDPRVTAARIAAEQQKALADAAEAQRKQFTMDAVQAAFSQFGLSSLFPIIQQYAMQGLSADAIYLNLRNTAEYKNRFPAMAKLSSEGRAITEAQYVDYERQAASIEQRLGFPKGMIMGQVTTLLENDVSALELQDRAQLAAADSISAPADLKQQIRDYYEVDPDTALRAYYLDPEVSMPILQKQSAAARIGVWAGRQGVLGVDRTLAEGLQGLGVTEQEAQSGFGKVAYQSGLSAGKGDTIGTRALIGANLEGNAAAAAEAQRVAASRTGRFGGGGQYSESKQGVSGIGAASV